MRVQETKSSDACLTKYPVNLCGSRTYIVIKRIASFSLIATVLLLGGCYHHYDDDYGWRDRDRDHRYYRYDRDDDDHRYRDRDRRDRYYRHRDRDRDDDDDD